MIKYDKLRRVVIGAPLDPLSQTTRQHIALAAFIAWVGLGADGLSSSAYGPEEAFKALGAHTHLGPVHGAGHRGDGVHHRARLQPGHRAVSDRRRRLSRRHQPDRPARGPRLRRRADRRLRADDRDIGRQRRRRAVQPAAGGDRPLQARHRAAAGRGAAGAQHARDEGVDSPAAADLCRLLHHPPAADRLRHPRPLARA